MVSESNGYGVRVMVMVSENSGYGVREQRLSCQKATVMVSESNG
jgi:hypothetical protein